MIRSFCEIKVLALGVVAGAVFSIVLAFIFRNYWLYSYVTDISQRHYIQNMSIFHKRASENLPESATVLLGDSHIQSLASSAFLTATENFGIGGDTVDYLVHRHRLRGFEFTENQSVVLQIGYNDLLINDASEVIKKYSELLGLLKNQRLVIVNSVFYIEASELANQELNEKIQSFNELLNLLVSNYKWVTFLDVNALILTSDIELSEIYLNDGVHLSSKVNRFWISMLNQIIDHQFDGALNE